METIRPATEEEARKIILDQAPPKSAHKAIQRANPRLLESLRRYYWEGGHVGDFLTQVLEDNLHMAVSYADEGSLRVLGSIVIYNWNYPPSNSWGSEEAVRAWREEGGLVGAYGWERAFNLAHETL